MSGIAERTVVLLSGGMDSSTCLGLARAAGQEILPLTFAYGQRHAVELECARRVADFYGLADRHRVIDLTGFFAGSSLLDAGQAVPAGRSLQEIGAGIPSTYVPARNIVFLACALAVAEPLGAQAIYIGVNALDYSGYPDCRPEFVHAFQRVIDQGTAAGVAGRGVRLLAPLLHLSKAEIICLGTGLGVPYHLTCSCYNGASPACGVCDACQLRRKGFQEAGCDDPIPYARPERDG